jgi:hypothetical protein
LKESMNGVKPGEDAITIKLSAFVAAQLHLREPGGRPLQVSPDAYGRGMSWTAENSSWSVLPDTPPEFLLLVDEAFWDARPVHPHDPLLLFVGEAEHGTDLRVQYDVEVPGYQPAWSEVLLRPVSRTVPAYDVVIEPLSSRWGSLLIRCSGTFADIVPDSTTNALIGSLRMTCHAERGDSMVVIPVRKPCAGEHVIDGLPYGEYTGVFVRRDWVPTNQRGEPPIAFTIGQSRAEVFLEVADVGALRIELSDSAGARYTGEATFRARKGNSDAYFTYRRAPYVLDGLEPGEYTVVLERLPGVDAPSVKRVTTEVTAGGVADLAMYLK